MINSNLNKLPVQSQKITMSDQQIQNPQAAAHSAAHTLTLADYRALRRAMRKLNPVGQTIETFSTIIILFLILSYLVWAYTDWGPDWDFLSGSAPVVLYGALYLTVFAALKVFVLSSWAFRRCAIANKPVTITFGENGIVQSSEGVKSELAWSKMTRLVTLKGYLFLFISRVEAICIPQRALASEDVFHSLVTYAKARVNAQAL